MFSLYVPHISSARGSINDQRSSPTVLWNLLLLFYLAHAPPGLTWWLRGAELLKQASPLWSQGTLWGLLAWALPDGLTEPSLDCLAIQEDFTQPSFSLSFPQGQIRMVVCQLPLDPSLFSLAATFHTEFLLQE